MSDLGTLTVPEVINFGDEDAMLDYEKIKETTAEAKRKAILERKVVSTKEVIQLSSEEAKKVKHYSKEVEKYVKQWAEKGETRFLYDCAKLDFHVFMEIAQYFKNTNPRFYVQTNQGTQLLTVTWDGKNEC